MNRKFISVVFAALLFSGVALAENGEKRAENFEAMKAERLKHIDARISKMQEHRSCVASASQGDAMKACHESMKAFRESEHEHMKEHREGRKEARAKRRAEKDSQ